MSPASRTVAPVTLLLAFLVGALTETGSGAAARPGPALTGTSAAAAQDVALLLQGVNGPLLQSVREGTQTASEDRVDVRRTGRATDVVVGGEQVELLPDLRSPSGEPLPAVVDGLLAPLEDSPLLPDMDVEACARVAAYASTTAQLADAFEEGQAVVDACAQVEDHEADRPVRPAFEYATPEPQARVEALVAGVLADRAVVLPLVVSLQARVVPGRTTRSAVSVLLSSRAGQDAPSGELVRVAYPGGSNQARTGRDGRVLLAVPDVALDGPLPLTVTWRGTAPAGSRIGPVELAGQDPDDGPVYAGWLRSPLDYALEVVVVRDGVRG